MKPFLLMVQMFTRLPLPQMPDTTVEDYRRGIIYLPLIGGCIGLLFFAVAAWAPHLLSVELTSLLLFILWVFITGGIHLDGLADTADGFFSNREPERVLEIMKDSLIGTFGVIALILALTTKFLLIREVLLAGSAWLLVLPPLFARFSLVTLCWRGNYARKSGMGDLFIGRISAKQTMGAFLWMLPVLVIIPLPTVLLLLLLSLYTAYYRRVCGRKIGGLTGDTLGAHVEIVEVITLLLLVVLN